VQKYQNAIQDLKGNAIAGASINVYLYGTLTTATIYSDNGVTPITPGSLTTDSEGEFGFYAANGRYTVSVVATGFTSQNFYDVLLFDPADGGVVSVKDFATTADSAVTAGTVNVPNNYAVTLPASFPNTTYDFLSRVNLSVYANSESGLRYGRRVLKSQQAGSHSGTQESVFGIEFRPTGSGANGAANADIGETISVVKKGYPSATTQGEIDGLNVVVRQSGTASSDAAGILVDVANITGCGFLAAWEAGTTTFLSGGVTVSKKVQTQVGVIDTVANLSTGFYADAETGALDDGLRLRATTGVGTWTNFINCLVSGSTVFKVTGAGSLTATSTVINGIAQANNILLKSAATAAGAGDIMLGNATSTTATAGAAGAPPAQVLGYISAYLGGTLIKIPYYAA
jgi:hypothetical protein